MRVPFTALNDGEDVVLGYDVDRLEGVLLHGELGGTQAAQAVPDTVDYDDFTTPTLDPLRWEVGAVGRNGPRPHVFADPNLELTQDTGELTLRLEPFTRFVDKIQALSDPKQLFVSTSRFAPQPGKTLRFETAMSVTTDGARAMDPYDALGMTGFVDLLTGNVMGFAASNDAVYAVHQRVFIPGVTREEEEFSHRVALDVEQAAMRFQNLAVSYSVANGELIWEVEERTVYRTVAATPMEGLHLGMGLYSATSLNRPLADRAHGQGVTATWRPWRVSSVPV